MRIERFNVIHPGSPGPLLFRDYQAVGKCLFNLIGLWERSEEFGILKQLRL